MGLLKFTSKGIYCAAGGFYIDPWKPVKIAVTTHAHSDHARWGSRYYITHKDNIPVLKLRLGENINVTGFDYGKRIELNGVRISLHPAGHIIGSSQVRVEYKGEIWVVSGDYKLENDSVCAPFEPIKCHTFITESTFGLPVFKWEKQDQVFNDINSWWCRNAGEGKVSILAGYALGKAQRLIQGLDPSQGKIFTHGAIQNIQDVLIKHGIQLKQTTRVNNEIQKNEFKGCMVVVPPSALGSPWMRRFEPYSTAVASGWMALRGARRRRSVDRGFILSDHADWHGLLTAIKDTGAENIFVTHGYTASFARFLSENGYSADEAKTEFTGDLSENEAV